MNKLQDDHFHVFKNGIVDTLRTVMDPELGINVVDMGLVYGLSADISLMQMEIRMTLSSEFCPLGESILGSARNALERRFAGFKVMVILSWEPEWNYKFISQSGLNMLKKS